MGKWWEESDCLVLDSVIGSLLSTPGTTWVWVHFVSCKYKYRADVSTENCRVWIELCCKCQTHPGFQTFKPTTTQGTDVINTLYTDYLLKWGNFRNIGWNKIQYWNWFHPFLPFKMWLLKDFYLHEWLTLWFRWTPPFLFVQPPSGRNAPCVWVRQEGNLKCWPPLPPPLRKLKEPDPGRSPDPGQEPFPGLWFCSKWCRDRVWLEVKLNKVPGVLLVLMGWGMGVAEPNRRPTRQAARGRCRIRKRWCHASRLKG